MLMCNMCINAVIAEICQMLFSRLLENANLFVGYLFCPISFVTENVLHECRQRPTGGFESIVYEFHMLFQNELSSSI